MSIRLQNFSSCLFAAKEDTFYFFMPWKVAGHDWSKVHICFGVTYNLNTK